VSLINYYVGFVLVGDLADYLIGLIVEREFGGHASLIVFLALYALVFVGRLAPGCSDDPHPSRRCQLRGSSSPGPPILGCGGLLSW
jgi:hypothetical protein